MSSSEDLPRYPQESAAGQPSAPRQQPLPGPDANPGPVATSSEERNWAVGAHLGSFLAAYVALGMLAPLAVLLFKGNDSPFIRRHAIESLNFQLTALIYAAVCFVLIFVLVGIFLFVALGIFYLGVVIMGSVRASHGEHFRYPLTFRFLS